MNYYRRYVGDYLRDTSELSLAEHGAYTLLLDYYYAEEKPLPLGKATLYRKVRALDAAEQQAVDSVLRMFFEMREDGYHQKRADREIQVSQQARANGRSGGRPTHHEDDEETGKQTGKGTGNETGSETGMQTGEATETITGSGHPPTTNHHPPTTTLQPPSKVNTASPEPSAKGRARSRPAVLQYPGETVVKIPVVGYAEPEIEIPRGFADEMQAAYPKVDVEATLGEIRAWCLANPSNRKTVGGVTRFINSWLSREQNRG